MSRAIVTGASSGIGKCIYDYFKTMDFDSVEGVSRRGPDAFVDFEVEEAGYFARCKPCDILVLNHGFISENEVKDQERLVSCLLTSYFQALHLQAHERQFVKRGGCIMVVASVSGVTGDPRTPLYAALKAGVINLVKSYALLLAPQDIRVNAISPGFVKTNLFLGDTDLGLAEQVPLGRVAATDEVLPLVDALVAAHYMTGQNIVLDGGLSL